VDGAGRLLRLEVGAERCELVVVKHGEACPSFGSRLCLEVYQLSVRYAVRYVAPHGKTDVPRSTQ